jgi:hypothetical protein
MIHVGIKFPEQDQMVEVKALHETQGMQRGEALARRWNQPSCTVYRINPHNATKDKKVLAMIENDNYNPELRTKTNDNEIIAAHNAAAQDKVKKKRKKKDPSSGKKVARPDGSTATVSSPHTVPLAAIAEKIDKDPAALRRKLRKSDIDKPQGGWGWSSWEDPAVQEILSWGK